MARSVLSTSRKCGPCLLTLLLGVGHAWSADLRVPEDHATIAAAIDAAANGDRVIIAPGSYAENLQLRSNVSLRGREAARVLLSPASQLAPTVTLEAVDDVVLANITFLDADTAVRVIASDNVTIASNAFSTIRQIAVETDLLSDVDVLNNAFFDNGAAVVRGSADTHLRNNIFARNTVAITGSGGFGDNNINVSFNCFFQNGTTDPVFGTSFRLGDPRFVDSGRPDFHLQQDSACIDSGTGTDVIDDSTADAGAYGGGFADALPYPVPRPEATDASSATSAAIDLVWQRNLAYLVTNSVTPGGYRVHYSRNVAGPPFDGTDAGGGTQPSPIDAGNVTTFRLADLQPTAPTGPAPQLSSAVPRDAAAVLSWTATAAAVGYRVLYGVNAVDENQADVGATTTHTVTGLTNGTPYRFTVLPRFQATYHLAVTAVDSTPDQNESALSATATLSLGPITEGPRSNELVAIPSATVPVPNLPDTGCFIATAAYRSDSAAPVLILRDFRDRYLMPHALGRALVRGYYRLSPALARALEASPGWQGVVRGALAPLVAAALLLVAAGAPAKSALAALLLALAALRWRQRRPRQRSTARSRA